MVKDPGERYGEAMAELRRAEERVKAAQWTLDAWYREFESMVRSTKGYLRDKHAATMAQLSDQVRGATADAALALEEAEVALWGRRDG